MGPLLGPWQSGAEGGENRSGAAREAGRQAAAHGGLHAHRGCVALVPGTARPSREGQGLATHRFANAMRTGRTSRPGEPIPHAEGQPVACHG